MAHLEIALLGSLQVTRDRQPVTRFETGAARLLLAYLAMHAGIPIQREVLADLLWSKKSRAAALLALRQTLNRVRRALDELEGAPCFLHVTPQSVEFDAESDYWLDVDAFRSLIASVRRHHHRRLTACHSCMRQLTQAAELYRGELLSGFHLESLPFQEWLVMERESLHRQAMEVFFHLANIHTQHGEYTQAQIYARRQLAAEPWREEAHRQLMAALALSGQRSAALAQYAACCRILADELGVEPERKTRLLYEQICAETFPPAAPPHNLPAPLTRFIGREAELERIAERLNTPAYRLLTLTGPDGVVKTRLADTLGRLGFVFSVQQEYAAAEPFYQESLALYRALGDQSGVARVLSELGYLAFRQGDLVRARSLLEESLTLFREPDDLYLASRAWLILGHVARLEGDHTQARSLYSRAIVTLRELGNCRGIFHLLEAFGHLALAEGQPERAVRLLGAAERLGKTIGTALAPPEQVEHERGVAAARTALGESAFAAAWAAGQTMTLEEAIACVLEDPQ